MYMGTKLRAAHLRDPYTCGYNTSGSYCDDSLFAPPPGSDAARSSSGSSLTLQQHLSHHYRALAAARPTIDTGQKRQRKRREDGRRRWRRDAEPAEAPYLSGSAADGLRLVEAILGDDRLPPQYYCRQQEHGLPLASKAEDGSLLQSSGSGQRSPSDADSILGKIDSYLSQVRATKADQAARAARAARDSEATRTASNTTAGHGGRRHCPGHQRPPPAAPARSLVSHKRQVITGDVIERFPQDFTAKRPFRPQVLRTSVSPRLRYLRVYRGPLTAPRTAPGRSRPPRPAPSIGSTSTSATFRSTGEQSARRGRARGRTRRASSHEGSEEYREDTEDAHTGGEDGEEDKEDEEEDEEYGDDFEDEDGVDVEQESSGGVSSRVPPLSISPDSDQEAWLREQASKALTRQRAAHVVKTNYRSPSKDSAYGGFSSSSRGPTPEETAAQGSRPAAAARGPPPPQLRPTVAPPAPTQPAPKPAQRYADEQAYVQFLNDVTSDILARGVFTNRILKRVMEAHVDKHRGKLNTARMRSELEKLREQLGIPDDDTLDDTEHGFGSVRSGRSRDSGGASGGGDGGGRASRVSGGRVSGGGASGGSGGADGDTMRTLIGGISPPHSPLAVEPRHPTFVESLLYPSGEAWEDRRPGAGAATAAPSVERTAAPPGGREVALESSDQSGSMAALLASLSLDESVTQTILNCCQKQTQQTDSASVTSEELRECLNWRTPHTDVT